jgi:GNAT superfamily N-acetyltransferase
VRGRLAGADKAHYRRDMSVLIRQAVAHDLDALAPLFDAYRRFYDQAGDLQLARQFLADRFRLRDSTIFLACTPSEEAIGFTQLYPSFTSAGCARIYILNDLFVEPAHRGTGVGRVLLEATADFGRSQGAVRLTLATGIANHPAQALYERAGWRRNEAFVTYNLGL